MVIKTTSHVVSLYPYEQKNESSYNQLLPLSGSLFFNFDHWSTSVSVDVGSSEPGDPENIGVGVEIAALSHSSAEI